MSDDKGKTSLASLVEKGASLSKSSETTVKSSLASKTHHETHFPHRSNSIDHPDVSGHKDNVKFAVDAGEPDIIYEAKASLTKSEKSETGGIGEDGDALLGTREHASFEDLVLYNREGNPYIDINRLVYKPKPRQHTSSRIEQKIWYWPDYVFLFCNFVSVLGSTYLFLVGTTAVSWVSSIDSVTGVNSDMKTQSILKAGLSDVSPSTMGLLLVGVGILNVINVGFGTHAIVVGYKTVLIQHVIADIGLVVAELTLGGIMTSGQARCDEADIKAFETKIKDYIMNYATKEPTMQSLGPPNTNTNSADREAELTNLRIAHRIKEIQLDNIQIALSCCGVNGYRDYMERDFIGEKKKSNLDGSELVFPVSCCRPWWVRNLYCATGAHLWADSDDSDTAFKFRHRINQYGCLPRVKIVCKRTLFLMGPGLIGVGGIHILLVLAEAAAVFFHIRDIEMLVRERQRLTRQEERQDDEEDEDSDISIQKRASKGEFKSAVEELRATLPIPTEDQIHLVKARSDFNTFEARVKRTHIGKWMSVARKSVNVLDAPTEVEFINVGVNNPDQVHIMESTSQNIERKEPATKNMDVAPDEEVPQLENHEINLPVAEELHLPLKTLERRRSSLTQQKHGVVRRRLSRKGHSSGHNQHDTPRTSKDQ